MATITTRPDATIINEGTVVGAASAHAALSDNSDSSYVELDGAGGSTRLGFAEPAIPAGSALKSIALRVRCRKIGGTSPIVFAELVPPDVTGTGLSVTWTTPTTVTLVAPQPISASPSPVEVELWNAANVARIVELYVDTIHVPKPVVDVTGPTGTVAEDDTPLVTWTVT